MMDASPSLYITKEQQLTMDMPAHNLLYRCSFLHWLLAGKKFVCAGEQVMTSFVIADMT